MTLLTFILSEAWTFETELSLRFSNCHNYYISLVKDKNQCIIYSLYTVIVCSWPKKTPNIISDFAFHCSSFKGVSLLFGELLPILCLLRSSFPRLAGFRLPWGWAWISWVLRIVVDGYVWLIFLAPVIRQIKIIHIKCRISATTTSCHFSIIVSSFMWQLQLYFLFCLKILPTHEYTH